MQSSRKADSGVARIGDEGALTALAGRIAERWRDAAFAAALTLGLRGELGAGKTTWVRGMLQGLGYTGRVPSPTYTLLEEYAVGPLRLVHLDLYRLVHDSELEGLGIRDWLGRPRVWVVAEWPERAPRYLAGADLVIEIRMPGAAAREIEFRAATPAGREWLGAIHELLSS